MGLKTAGVGHFLIPTAPAAGTSCTSGSANVFTTTYVQMIASTGAAIFLTGVSVQMSTTSKPTYIAVQIATGAAGSETIVDQEVLMISTAGATGQLFGAYVPIVPPVPVATSTRIAVKTADSVGALAGLVTLTCINQSNVVDDGIAVGTVTTVTNLTTYTGNTPQTGDSFARIGVAGVGLTNLGDTRIANLDAAVSSRMATYAQPTGFLAATFPSGTIANTTNITAGTVTTATNLTTNNDKTGYALSSAGVQAIWDALTSALTTVGSLGKKLADWVIGTTQTGDSFARIGAAGAGLTALGDARIAHLDADVSTRLASASYTAPDNTSVTAIKAKTDSLTFTVAGKVDGNIKAVNNTAINGAGTSGSPWGP